jgi:signal transduction histidine kinase
VTSELVSNAIEHAMTPVAVRIRNENRRVRVEVSDRLQTLGELVRFVLSIPTATPVELL